MENAEVSFNKECSRILKVLVIKIRTLLSCQDCEMLVDQELRANQYLLFLFSLSLDILFLMIRTLVLKSLVFN